MSRTIRRKKENYEPWTAGGGKLHPTCVQLVPWEGEEDVYGLHWRGWRHYYYRLPTKREEYMNFRCMHGESSHANERSPGRSVRYPRTRQWRNHNKREVFKWMKDENYEPLTWDDPLDCKWDWR